MKKLLFLCIATCTNLILYGQLDRSVRPTGSTAPTINIKESEVFTLPNGITIILSENHKLPRVSFNFVLGSNPILEGSKTGLSSLAGELLMSGTEKRSKDQLDQEIDYIGATLRSSSQNVFLQCLTKHAEKGLDLMSDVLLRPTFPEEEFDRLKKMKESNILSSKSNPGAMASNAEARANFPTGHPYGEVETENTLRDITISDVKNYYRGLFTPKGSYLVIVGDVTKEQAKRWAEHYFGTWEGHDKITSKYNDPYFHAGNRVLFVAKPGAPQSVITVSFPMKISSGDKNQLILNTLNGIFGGGGFGARLSQNLREKRAYTYGCYSKANVTEDGSYYSISGNFRNDVTDSAVAQILFELDRIQKSEVTDEELSGIKALLAGNFARSLEKPMTIAQFALNIIKFNLPKDYYQTYLKRLDGITKAEILDAAKQYLTASGCNIIVVGNPAILDKLKRFDSDGTIEKLDALGQEIKETKKATISKEVLIEKYLTSVTNTTSLKKAHKTITKIKTLKRETELTAPQIPMPIIKLDYLSQNDKETMLLSMAGNTIQKSVYNGDKGYDEDQRGKTPMTKESLDAKKKVAGIFPELYFTKHNINYELLGIEVVNGKDAYVLKYSDGIKETYDYFDVATFYKIRSISSEEGNSQTFNYGDFKQVNGIFQPYTISIEMQGLTLNGIVKNIEINGKIDSSIFE
jgi:predicted Zn-dependent peptidase